MYRMHFSYEPHTNTTGEINKVKFLAQQTIPLNVQQQSRRHGDEIILSTEMPNPACRASLLVKASRRVLEIRPDHHLEYLEHSSIYRQLPL